MPEDENDELGPKEQRQLERFYGVLSALCCAASYITSADDHWEQFKNWLMGQLDDETAAEVGGKISREEMVGAIADADRMLMMAEGIRALAAPDFIPPWMTE